MRLDEAGEPSSIAELVTRYAGRPWLYEITDLHHTEKQEADEAGTVRRYPHGLSTDEPITTGEGPYVIVVEGDLSTTDHLDVNTDDYVQGRLIITGNLRTGSFLFDNGARVVVEGAAHIRSVVVGQHGDRNAVLDVGGELSVPLLVLDSYTTAAADAGVQAVIYAGPGWWQELKPDIMAMEEDDGQFFPAELLDYAGSLDPYQAIAAARAGKPILLPGIAESFPARTQFRPTR